MPNLGQPSMSTVNQPQPVEYPNIPTTSASPENPVGHPACPTNQSCSTTPIDKLNYLKSFMDRAAAESIAGLSLTNANYEEAIVILKSSQCSYISSTLTGTLGLQSKGQRSVNIKTFGSNKTNAQVIDVVNLGIETAYGANIEMLAFTVPLIGQPLKNQFMSNASKTYPHLTNLRLADYSSGQHDAKVDILIGSDHYRKIMTGKTRQGDSGPTAIQTRLGWVLSGPVGNELQKLTHTSNLATIHTLKCASEEAECKNDVLVQELKRFWDLETLGIQPQCVYEEFLESIKHENNHYVITTNSKELQERICQTNQLVTVNNAPDGSNMARADSNKSQQLVEEEQSSYTGGTLGPPPPASDDKRKILRTLWDSYEDNLIIDIKDVADLAQMVQAMKRNVISISFKIYDPMGFISPLTINFKLLLQELCLAKGDWDHPLEGTLKCNWQKLVDNLKEVQPLVIPRCYIFDIHKQVISYELHSINTQNGCPPQSPAKENIDDDVVPEECRIEMKVKDQRALDKDTLSTMIVHGLKDSISNVINCKDYSSLGHLLRVTAVVLKFIKLLKSRVKLEDPPTNSEVTSTDIELA
ncbi:Hypothetical predicted protein [Paramuricea clavata]|uniref:Uncharacterized protein n=1 Tax=Paramuricea clavata TaxID=317549 RepID=A0A6S7G0V2_PARCT|nr:Hypothetical predicted protein [Paramuricea clavata]